MYGMYDQYPQYEEEEGNPQVWVSYDSKVASTDDAILFLFEKGEDFDEPPIPEVREWIPKSQIQDEDESEKRIEIPEWLALKKGLI